MGIRDWITIMFESEFLVPWTKKPMHKTAPLSGIRMLRDGIRTCELPVVRSTKFELVINAQIARRLGLTVPPSLLATADEVID